MFVYDSSLSMFDNHLNSIVTGILINILASIKTCQTDFIISQIFIKYIKYLIYVYLQLINNTTTTTNGVT